MLEAEAIKVIIGSLGATGAVIVMAFLWVKAVTDAHKQDIKEMAASMDAIRAGHTEYLKGENTRNSEQLKLLVTAVDKLATVAAQRTPQ